MGNAFSSPEAVSPIKVIIWNEPQSQNHFTTGGLRQTVRLGVKPLETHDQRQFFLLNPCDHSPYVTSFVTRR
jgi:hypothetical protein